MREMVDEDCGAKVRRWCVDVAELYLRKKSSAEKREIN